MARILDPKKTRTVAPAKPRADATTRKHVQYLRDQLTFSVNMVKRCSEDAQFFFRHRGRIDSAEVWGDGPELKYTYCREQFRAARGYVKWARRQAVRYVELIASYEAKYSGI